MHNLGNLNTRKIWEQTDTHNRTVGQRAGHYRLNLKGHRTPAHKVMQCALYDTGKALTDT